MAGETANMVGLNVGGVDRGAIHAFDINARCGEIRAIERFDNCGLTIVSDKHRAATSVAANAVMLGFFRFDDRMLALAVDSKMPMRHFASDVVGQS